MDGDDGRKDAQPHGCCPPKKSYCFVILVAGKDWEKSISKSSLGKRCLIPIKGFGWMPAQSASWNAMRNDKKDARTDGRRRRSEHPDERAPRRASNRKSEHSDKRATARVSTRTSQYPDERAPGRASIRTSEHPDERAPLGASQFFSPLLKPSRR